MSCDTDFDLSKVFGSNVFNDSVMRRRLPKEVYKNLKETVTEGKELDKNIADIVANEMKDWAIEKGATHFTHWFQPMTGKTAEKHDSFLSLQKDGTAIMEFSGKELIKGEPDASSFPSGGLRVTFEARGYTAWDCTSPAFLKEDESGVTLCIPTAFCSYTGEALDKKTPLLRSMEAVSKQALRVVKLFGNENVKRVTTTVGAEQEYFIVDKKLYQQRKDLIFTGRTLFGAKPPKGQELDDHYFGTIKERIAIFMKEIDIELWKLGVSAKTKHNEVAPAQHELAPIFSTTNIAVDHNQLMMETMKKVAMRQDLVCLLHEKPFEGINGSGKHNNWSISTDDGQILLKPGKTPHDNMQFLTFLTAIIAAVDEYAPLLRVSAANAGNDHRLGGNEAPPAIISMFLGEQLEDIIEQIVAGDLKSSIKAKRMHVGVTTLPAFRKDATDRNRTSPFAFTGNRFEFRMPASSSSVAGPNIMLNTIIAETLKQIADEVEGAENVDEKLVEVITRMIKQHKRIIFNGNGYSDEWVKEAEKRGLPNITSTVEAIGYYSKQEYVEVFERHGVFSKVELESREEILYEEYSKQINIEALTMIHMVKREILPSCIEYATELATSINTIKMAAPVNVSVQQELLTDISNSIVEVQENLNKLEKLGDEAESIINNKDQAFFYSEKVMEAMDKLRRPVDKLEMLVPEKKWPMPVYADLLFRV